VVLASPVNLHLSSVILHSGYFSPQNGQNVATSLITFVPRGASCFLSTQIIARLAVSGLNVIGVTITQPRSARILSILIEHLHGLDFCFGIPNNPPIVSRSALVKNLAILWSEREVTINELELTSMVDP
jgi:hypothetical protein